MPFRRPNQLIHANKRFPNLPRFGVKAGQPNHDYLNANLFATAILTPCEAIREKVGVLMFEFSRFRPIDYEHGRDFANELDAFLGKLPKGWPYAVEIRNRGVGLSALTDGPPRVS